jgi:zinc protease
VNRLSPDYFPLTVGNGVLGSGTASRLFNDIREKQGFAYSVYSHIIPLKDSGVFDAAMQVRNEVTGQALSSMLSELQGMASAPVTATELSDIKNFLSGTFVLRLQTQDGLATQLAGIKAIGMPLDYLEKYTTRVRSVEPDQIQAVAKKIIAPDESSIVVVGDAKQIGPALEKFGKVDITSGK